MDILEADLNLLRVFHAVAEENSLTLAAARLKLSQPAVSYALGRLRVMFNDPLFVRSGNAMQPTSAALELREPIRRAMEAIQQALHHGDSFDPARSTRTFRIAMSDIGEMVFLPPLCDRLAMEAPHIRLEVSQMPQEQIAEALRSGRLDLAIGNLPALKAETRYEPLFHEAYVCMTCRREGDARTALTVEEYLAMPHVHVQSAEHSHRLIEDFLLERKLRRNIALQLPHFSVVPQLLRRRPEWAVTLPRSAARSMSEDGHLAVFELPVPLPEVEVTVHWHADFEDNAANRWLRTLIVATLAH